MNPTLPQDADAFLEKWRTRWPQWRIAQAFVAPEQRPLAEAWFALLAEWMEAALGGEEAAPGLAKLAWWQEELRGWSSGARRHPLAGVLQKQPVHWMAIADALPALRHRDALRSQPEQAIAALVPFTQAVAQGECALWPSGCITAPALAHLLLAEASTRGQHASTPQVWAQAWPELSQTAAPRRIHAALLRSKINANGALSGWRTLGLSWQAARN